MTVKGDTSTGSVFIWSTATSSPEALIRLMGSTSTGVPPTRVEDLHLIGTKRGIQITTGSAKEFDGVIARCNFGMNKIAVDLVHQEDSTVQVAIRGCKIGSELPAYLPPSEIGLGMGPVGKLVEVGVRLHAIELDGSEAVPRVEAEIKNLTTHGPFDNMRTSSAGAEFDPPVLNDEFDNYFTRLIEAYAYGTGFHKEHSLPGFKSIPEVRVSVLGGDLDGKADAAAPANGWDVGIFAGAKSKDQLPWKDFVAGVNVQITGTSVTGCRELGLYGRSEDWTRVELDTSGGTEVRETGRHLSPGLPLFLLLSGALIETNRGYVNLAAVDSDFSKNTHYGIVVVTEETADLDDIAFPAGNRIDLFRCSIHQNGLSGIQMQPKEGGSGILGGTWHFVNFEKSLLYSPATTFSVDYGQGVIDACSISNNGQHGIHVLAPITSLMVTTRATNSVIWNNGLTGFHADFRNLSEAASPTILFPIEHCTIAGNQVWNYSIIQSLDVNGNRVFNPFQWTNSFTGEEVRTALYNTIFERQDSIDPDFSPETEDLLKFDHDTGNPVATTEVGVSALRYSNIGQPLFPDFHATQIATPFVDTSDWSTLDATNLYLASTGLSGEFDEVWPLIAPIHGSETDLDHAGDSRPSEQSGDRDKGAKQFP